MISFSAKSQNAEIKEMDRSMTTYPYSDRDPVARPGRVYPYFRFDGFINKSEMRNWKMVELENDYLKFAVMPEMGFGRYSPYYKKLGKKIWILGLSQEGARWENLLGDRDGLNVELQSGRLFTQASGSRSMACLSGALT
jgi:hypothetical protein